MSLKDSPLDPSSVTRYRPRMPHDLDPPVAPTRPVQRELHGVSWTDEYAWMSEPDSPELTAYLRAKRAFYDSTTGHLADLSQQLFVEVEQRLLPTDESVSSRRGDLFYYTRTVAEVSTSSSCQAVTKAAKAASCWMRQNSVKSWLMGMALSQSFSGR